MVGRLDSGAVLVGGKVGLR